MRYKLFYSASLSAFLLLLLSLSACETVLYYHQAASGQLSLLWQRESIEKILAQDAAIQLEQYHLDAEKAAKLAEIENYLAFARQNLGLPADDLYRDYVALPRQYVIWNVFAAPEFELTAKTWCFPVAGCVAYRGYFKQAAAEAKAAQLQEKGLDVYVGGVEAYSTLGWFDDPVLSTFLQRSLTQLAALIFHELAHKQLYLPGDTQFSESFASAVEEEGVRRWLLSQGRMADYAEYQQRQQAWQAVLGFLQARREQLKAVYQNPYLDEASKRQEKALLLSSIVEDFSQQHPDLYPYYQHWLNKPFNNARLLTLASYQDWVPAFTQLLQQYHNDLPAFYAAVKQLSLLNAPEREKRLKALSQQALGAQ